MPSNDTLDSLVAKFLRIQAIDPELLRIAFEKDSSHLTVDQQKALWMRIIAEEDAHVSVPQPSGGVDASDSTFGDYAQVAGRDINTFDRLVGVNIGRVVYGRDPEEDERRRLVRYLDRMVQRYGNLSLRGLAKTNKGLEDIALKKVYVTLATADCVILDRVDANKPVEYLDDKNRLKPDYDPEYVLPDKAIIDIEPPQDVNLLPHAYRERSFFNSFKKRVRSLIIPVANQNPQWIFLRSRLAIEAVNESSQIIILGDPGSGKSVFLRYLAWSISLQNLTDVQNDKLSFPVFLSLRRVAGELAKKPAGQSNNAALIDMIEDDAKQTLGSDSVEDILRESLLRGRALMLLDGLDEVPLQGAKNVISRHEVFEAISQFAREYPHNRFVMTCRVRAFSHDFIAKNSWQVQTLAPFTLGQIRHFLDVWYGELIEYGLITDEKRTELTTILINAITEKERLYDMATSPLLLTLMAQVLYADGRLPRDRPKLYERILELLLGVWDAVRDGEDLASVIGHPAWGSERIMPLLDKLSYEAHKAAQSSDGRGRLKKDVVRSQLIDFFKNNGAAQLDPWQAAGRCLEYLEQRSGLLGPDNDDEAEYVFAHLTFQEHCAGRYLLLNPMQAAEDVMVHRHDDRWREPIFLGLGVVQDTNPALVNDILRRLIDRDEGDRPQPKSLNRWYRDIILAAEVGNDRDWDYLRVQRVSVGRLQTDIQSGLTAILNDPDSNLSALERQRAAELLAPLGDSRYPVTTSQWTLRPLTTEFTSRHDFYWRLVYSVGNPLWVSRLPITVEQFAEFMQAGGYENKKWWTPAGWLWRVNSHRVEPYLWNAERFRLPNQPVVGITWYEARAFCLWLNTIIPKQKYEVRLPTDEEWLHITGSLDVQRWRYPWGNDQPTADLAVYSNNGTTLASPAPGGTCIRGMAPCGALDMAGNVWEWTQTMLKDLRTITSDVVESDRNKKSTFIAVRGGAYADTIENMHRSKRSGAYAAYNSPNLGFRIVVGPRFPAK